MIGHAAAAATAAISKLLFLIHCTLCHTPILKSELVLRAGSGSSISIYHSQCFKCVYCGQLLKSGEHYSQIGGQIVCLADYEIFIYQASMHQQYLDIEGVDSNRKTPKRPRTILNTLQRRAFKVAFEKSSKPCRKVREQLAKETGLSVRVVQVWFQNQRAKVCTMKKLSRKREVSKLEGVSPSEIDAKSSVDSKSNCDSEDELESNSDYLDVDEASNTEGKTDIIGNPIDALYHMQATYFDYSNLNR